MRGNVCIELHNHKTGLRDRIEGHNDVTDALQTMINFCVYSNLNVVDYTPIVNNLLGGVILMDKELSGTDIFIPGNAKIIGSGFQDSNSSSSIVGTYNSAESGIDETQKIYTHVWDFATSQANGTIKSLGLTTDMGGRYPNSFLTYRNYTITSTSRNTAILYVDEINNDVYYTKGYSASEVVYKQHCNFTDLMLHNTYNTLDGASTGKVVNVSSLGGIYSCIDGKNGNIYISYSVSGATIKFRVYKVSDLSFEQQPDLVINFAASSIPSTSIKGDAAINADIGYVYARSSNNQYIYKYDMNENKTTVYDISTLEINSGDVMNLIATPSGDLYCNSDAKGFRINIDNAISESDNFIKSTYSRIDITSNLWNNGIVTAREYYGIMHNLLMTNFNLPTPIEKTSTQSMKVIYTLTQE